MKALKCPNCGEPLTMEMVSALAANSTVSFCLKPHPGQRLSATTAFKALLEVEKALKALGRDHGVRTSVTIGKMLTEEDGTLVVDFIAANAVSEPA